MIDQIKNRMCWKHTRPIPDQSYIIWQRFRNINQEIQKYEICIQGQNCLVENVYVIAFELGELY